MKHTFKRSDGCSIVVEPSTLTDTGCFVRCLSPSGVSLSTIMIPHELCGVVAQAVELSAPAERPLINAQAIEAAKSFGEGLTV